MGMCRKLGPVVWKRGVMLCLRRLEVRNVFVDGKPRYIVLGGYLHI